MIKRRRKFNRSRSQEKRAFPVCPCSVCNRKTEISKRCDNCFTWVCKTHAFWCSTRTCNWTLCFDCQKFRLKGAMVRDCWGKWQCDFHCKSSEIGTSSEKCEVCNLPHNDERVFAHCFYCDKKCCDMDYFTCKCGVPTCRLCQWEYSYLRRSACDSKQIWTCSWCR